MVTFSLLLALIGLALYLPSITPKVNRIGEIMLLAGLIGVVLGPLGARVIL